jgi:hypothetical protein
MHSDTDYFRKPRALIRAEFSPLKLRAPGLRHQGPVEGTGPADFTADLGGLSLTTPSLQQWWNPDLVDQLRPLTHFHD